MDLSVSFNDNVWLSAFLPAYHAQFDLLARVWMSVGASGVRLTEAGQEVARYPKNEELTQTVLTARSARSRLELEIYGLSDDVWQAAADGLVELFASLLEAEAQMESLTAALVESQDRLVALYELTQAARKLVAIDDILDLLTSEACRLFESDGSFAVLIQADQPLVVIQRCGMFIPEEQILEAINLYRSDPSRHTYQGQKPLPADVHNLMLVSIPVSERAFAALGVYNRQSGEFASPEIKLAQAIADQIGAQIETTLLHQQALARIRFETEMELARQVQIALLPQSLPQAPGVNVYGTSLSALEVGGDFLDVVTRRDTGSLVFILGDVTGKGMPAALLMAMTRTVSHSAALNMPLCESAQLVKRLNMDLINDFSNVGMFCTVFVGLLDPVTHDLLYTNAGQSPIIYAPAGAAASLLEAEDIPVGVFDDYEYTSQSLILNPGDVFIIASDGFSEARNMSGEMFGYDRLLESVSALSSRSAREITEQLFLEVASFAGNHPQDDDRSILVIKMATDAQNNPA